MATLISKATGLFTAAGTWNLCSVTGENDSEAGNTALASSILDSSTFVLEANQIDAIAIKLNPSGTSAPTGTLSVTLRNSTTSTNIATITINASDLDTNGNGWYVFPLGLNHTPNGIDSYLVRLVRSTGVGSMSLFTNGTANNWTREIRRTATQAPAASDKLIIAGEHTGAGTGNSFTVTMDNTATTSFGSTIPPQGISINKRATLAWQNTASTNYYLKWKGVFATYGGGTRQVYTAGSPCDSTSTAVLEMDSAVNVDSGLVDFPGATVTQYGNPKWPTSAITGATNATPIEITQTAHGLSAGERVTIAGVLGNTAANGTWEVIASTGANTFTIGAINGALGGLVGTSTGNGAYTSGGTWQRLAYTRMTVDKAAAATVITVLSTAGMVAGDVVVFPSTSRTVSECESKIILTVDSPTQFTLTAGLTNAHSGTSPTQCEVGILTRNVKVRGVSSLLQGYYLFQTTSNVAIANVEFTQIGSATPNKRGIDITTTTGSCSISYCSLHDSTVTGSVVFTLAGASFNNVTLSNNVTFNFANVHLSIAATSGTWIVDANLFVRNTDSGNNLINFADIGGTFTNNTIVGATNSGLSLTEGGGAALGTHSGNTCHSNSGSGYNAGANFSGTITNPLSWRNSATGFAAQGAVNGLTVVNANLFGNTTNNITLASAINIVFAGGTSNGDTTFATISGTGPSANNIASDIVFENFNFGTVSGIKTAHTQDILCAGAYATLTLRSCTLASATQVASQSNLNTGSYIRAQRLGGVAGSNKTWTRTGTISIDTVIFDAASPSVRLTPNNASNKLATDGSSKDGYGSFDVPVASGTTVTISVRVRQSVVGDGTAYNGALPRLILRKNVSAGITADTLIATATSASSGAFETISGTTITVTDDSILSFVVDCDGTTGWVNVDTWTQSGAATQAAVRGEQFWLDGEPFLATETATTSGSGGTVIIA